MSLEDLAPFGYEWELEMQERMYGEAPYEGVHAVAHREAAQFGWSCPFDCEPDRYWEEEDPTPADDAPASEWEAYAQELFDTAEYCSRHQEQNAREEDPWNAPAF